MRPDYIRANTHRPYRARFRFRLGLGGILARLLKTVHTSWRSVLRHTHRPGLWRARHQPHHITCHTRHTSCTAFP